jgi:hypothetical protein
MKLTDIRKKRMQGFDIDYPIIKKVKNEFNKKSIAKNFNNAKKGIVKSEIVPVSSYDLEEASISKIVNQLKISERRLVSSILKENNVSDTDEIEGINSKLSFIEKGTIDLDSREMHAYESFMQLDLTIKLSSNMGKIERL